MESDRSPLEALRASHLAEPDWVEANIHDPGITILDLQGYVLTELAADGSQKAKYLGAREDYEKGHIPGAVFVDWTRDIVDLDDPIPAQVAGPDKIAHVLAEAGVGDDTLVIAYDNHPASQFATRMWWVLRYYGHDNVRVLNGGLKRWIAEGRTLTSEEPDVASKRFTPRLRPELRRSGEEVLQAIGSNGTCLVDARDEGQYTGAIRRGKQGGHIPGAIHLPREALIGPDGTFAPSESLAEVIDGAGLREDCEVVAYCNGGVAATTVLFALSMLGRENWANYDGSWNEWGNRDDLPVETVLLSSGE
jgi:thiosulfate/3-mercaptopyruvate sulfurtransferase